MSGLRGRLKRLEKGAEEDRTVLECPACGKVFALHRDPAVEYLAHRWLRETRSENHGRPVDPAVVELAAHEHDPTLMVDRADGLPWLKEFFADTLATLDDAKDLGG